MSVRTLILGEYELPSGAERDVAAQIGFEGGFAFVGVRIANRSRVDGVVRITRTKDSMTFRIRRFKERKPAIDSGTQRIAAKEPQALSHKGDKS